MLDRLKSRGLTCEGQRDEPSLPQDVESGEHAHDHDAHEHSHGGAVGGHSHDDGHKHGGDADNINLRGAVIHVLGDFVQSIGVAIAGALIWWNQAGPVPLPGSRSTE